VAEGRDSDRGGEVKEVETALKKGFAEIKSEADAAKVLTEVEAISGETEEKDIPNAPADIQPAEQTGAIKAASEVAAPKERPVAVLAETARQIAASPPAAQSVLDAGIEKAAGISPSARGETLEVQRGRDLLRRELMRRLKPFDAIDAALFLQINHLWHPKALDRFFSWFSFLMTGGHAWALAVLLRVLVDRRRGGREFFEVVAPLYLATLTVEGPIKAYCRRRRPFISLVRAIVVGRKPGSYSFPSGHSAAAFAGASLLLRRYPRVAPFVVGIAFLVAFSRVYLGAHYPGDVLSGSFAGTILARTYQFVLKKLFGAL
jgi:membrane-associated phospholipid phosphatase